MAPEIVAETLPPPPKDRIVYSRPVRVPVAPDNEVRNYIENGLRPYLISLAKVACETRAAAASRTGRYGICLPNSAGGVNVEPVGSPEGEVITIPPKDGRPFPADSGPPRTGTP